MVNTYKYGSPGDVWNKPTTTVDAINITADTTTTGDLIELSGDALTTGTGLKISTTSADLAAGELINLSATSTDCLRATKTGAFSTIAVSRTDSATSSTTENYDVIAITRASIATGATGTPVFSGSVLRLANTATAAAGQTSTNSVKVLEIANTNTLIDTNSSVGIEIGANFGTGIDSVCKAVFTISSPSAAINGIYSNVVADAAWTTGSVAAIRGKNTISADGAGGNAYAGWFGLKHETNITTGMGLSCAVYAEAGSDIAGNVPTAVGYFQAIGTQDSSTMPIIVLCDDISTAGYKPDFLLEVGSQAASKLVTTGTGGIYDLNTLRIRANGDTKYLMMSAEERYLHIDSAAPTLATDCIHSTATLSENWSGSQTTIRGTATSSATGAIGNVYAGRFETNMAAQPSSSGHSTGLYVQGTTTDAATNMTSCLSVVKAGAAGGATTPILLLGDNATTKTNVVIDFGGVVGGGALGTGDDDVTKAFVTGGGTTNGTKLQSGIRVLVNNAVFFIPVIATGDWQTS